MTEQRLARLMAALETHDLDAAALNPGPTLTYLTGLQFHLMERPVVALFARGLPPAVVLPELEQAKLAALPFPAQAFAYGENPAGWPGVFRQAVQALHLDGRAVGVEPTRLRYLELEFLRQAAPSARFVPAGPALAGLRLRKDAAEIAHMRRAVHIAQEALQAVLPTIRAGQTEREIAARLTLELLRAGSEPELPFPPIVAAGPNSANPHAAPSDRPLQPGDLLIVDWGAAHNGYASDLTRTFAIGAVAPELAEMARVVAQANAAGRAAGRPGLPTGQVDAAARGVIAAAGFGAEFIHRTGHGLGMEAHEEPYIFGENEQPLAPGMVYTVEPGIYRAGVGGVRIEDNVVITESGCETLSDLPRELMALGA